jgi:hypothetical protein
MRKSRFMEEPGRCALPCHAQAGGEGVAGILAGNGAFVVQVDAHRLGDSGAGREAHHRAVARRQPMLRDARSSA